MDEMPQPPAMSYIEEKKYWTAHKAANGLTYYFNSKTKKSQWEKPDCLMTDDEKINESDWVEYNTAEGKVFYYNMKQKRSTWKMPEELRAIKERQKEQRKLQAQNFNKLSEEQMQLMMMGEGGLSGNSLLLMQNQQQQQQQQALLAGGHVLHQVSKARVKTEEELHEEAVRNYLEMLREKKINASMKFDQVQKELQNEERWKAIVKISERRNLFHDYIHDQKQRERQDAKSKGEKARMDFNKMLEESGITSEAKYYKTAHLFVHDQRFRVIEEKQREIYFQDYLDELFTKEREDIKLKKKENKEIFREKLINLKLNSDYTWDECCQQFKDDRTWNDMFEIDRITIFTEIIQNQEHQEFEDRRRQKRITERRNRENFRDLLRSKQATGELSHKTKWRNFVHTIKDDPRFLAMLGQQGSTPHELFEDQIENLKDYHKKLKPEIKQYIKILGWKVPADITYEDFIQKLSKFTLFNNTDESIKKYFFNLFSKKARSREKEALKKAKKCQKKFFKMLKNFKQIKSDSLYKDFEKDILLEIEEKYEGLKSLSIEQREKYFLDYIEQIINKNQVGANINDEGLVSSDNEEKKKKKRKKQLQLQQQQSPSGGESDLDRKTKKKKNYSPDQKDYNRKKMKYNDDNNNNSHSDYQQQQQQQHQQHSTSHQQQQSQQQSNNATSQIQQHSNYSSKNTHYSHYDNTQYGGSSNNSGRGTVQPTDNNNNASSKIQEENKISQQQHASQLNQDVSKHPVPQAQSTTQVQSNPDTRQQYQDQISNYEKIIQHQKDLIAQQEQKYKQMLQLQQQQMQQKSNQKIGGNAMDQEGNEPMYQQVQMDFGNMDKQTFTPNKSEELLQVEARIQKELHQQHEYQKMMEELEQINNNNNNNNQEEEIKGEEGEVKEPTAKEEGEIKEESSGKNDDESDDQQQSKNKRKHNNNQSEDEDNKDKGSNRKKNKKLKKKKEKEAKKHKSKKKKHNSVSSDSYSD